MKNFPTCPFFFLLFLGNLVSNPTVPPSHLWPPFWPRRFSHQDHHFAQTTPPPRPPPKSSSSPKPKTTLFPTTASPLNNPPSLYLLPKNFHT
ncbi:hypothetical protein GBA52_026002 [Prunus armeniaca]|nr:hypothetical protein GBA52_026002 [Prunus armeniaca]